MGSFITNHQVKHDSQERVIAVLKSVITEPAYVSDAANGWVSVFCEEADYQAEDQIGQQLSRELSAAVFTFLVHDSDVFCYWLYEQGELADEFNSYPDFGLDIDDEIDPDSHTELRARVVGQVDRVLPHCRPGTTWQTVDAVLHPPAPSLDDPPALPFLADFPPTETLERVARITNSTVEAMREQFALTSRRKYLFADSQLDDLAGLLGIDGSRASLSYRSLEVTLRTG